jgi:imidazolonepropionase-like amidohydrolase
MRHVLAVLALTLTFGSATLAAPAGAQDVPQSPALVALVGATVIDGTGATPLADAVVLVEGEKIKAIGRRRDVTIPPGTQLIDVTGKWVLPGFIELHTHLMYSTSYKETENTPADRALRALYYMNLYLRSGITTIRDLGGPPEPFQALMQAQQAGTIDSVRLYPAGQIIVTRAGFGPPPCSGCYRYANGPWDYRLAVREMFNDGFRTAKFHPPFSPEEIAAGIDEAKTLGMRTTVHSGWPTKTSMTRIAVQAGTQCVEHASDVPDDVLDMMAAKGIYFVPTLTVLREFFRPDGIVPREVRGDQTVKDHEDIFRKARKRGIAMGIGTDGPGKFSPRHPALFSFSSSHGFPSIGASPGWYFDEMKYFVELGVSPMEAIEAATKNGALILGEDSRLGTLAAGKLADLQVVEKNPLQSLDALGSPELVMVGGRVHSFPNPQPVE